MAVTHEVCEKEIWYRLYFLAKSKKDMNFFNLMLSSFKKLNMRLFIFIICLISFSCSESKENQTIRFSTDQISLSLSEPIPVNPWYVQHIEADSGEFVFLYNHFLDKFQFLNLFSGKIALEISFQREGEHGVTGLKLGTVIGLDSIWFTTGPPGIGLMNFNGEVHQRKRVEDDIIPLTSITSDFDRRLHRYGNKIFGAQPLFMDHHRMNKNDIKKQRLVYSYDFETGDVVWYDVFYGDNYWEQGKKPSGFSWTERKGKLYISPFHDHEIQVFDMKSEKVSDIKIIKSNYVNQFYYVNEIPPPGTALRNRFAGDRYGTLLYDKHRDVFFRLFWPSFDPDIIDESYNHDDLELSRPYMGVMVLDGDLNVLGEHIFDEFEVFSHWNHFVGKQGLYLSMNNVFNPEYNEDKLRYLIFTPELENR